MAKIWQKYGKIWEKAISVNEYQWMIVEYHGYSWGTFHYYE